jgi:hypothetical protein
MYKVAPLSGGFFLFSIFGFLISTIYVMDISETWGFAFALLFVLMFIASFISMTKAPIDEQLHLERLAIHEEIHNKQKNKYSRQKQVITTTQNSRNK